MTFPGFRADQALGKASRTYQGQYVHGPAPHGPAGLAANGGLEDDLAEHEALSDVADEAWHVEGEPDVGDELGEEGVEGVEPVEAGFDDADGGAEDLTDEEGEDEGEIEG